MEQGDDGKAKSKGQRCHKCSIAWICTSATSSHVNSTHVWKRMDIVIYDVIAVLVESLLLQCNEKSSTNLANAINEEFMRKTRKKKVYTMLYKCLLYQYVILGNS